MYKSKRERGRRKTEKREEERGGGESTYGHSQKARGKNCRFKRRRDVKRETKIGIGDR